jgi:hypothetical protein
MVALHPTALWVARVRIENLSHTPALHTSCCTLTIAFTPNGGADHPLKACVTRSRAFGCGEPKVQRSGYEEACASHAVSWLLTSAGHADNDVPAAQPIVYLEKMLVAAAGVCRKPACSVTLTVCPSQQWCVPVGSSNSPLISCCRF